MNNKTIGMVLISLIIGAAIGAGITKSTLAKKESVNLQTSKPTEHSAMQADSMTAGLKGKVGDDFDKAFLIGMTAHHQGAIEMGTLALQNANHKEIKDLAKAIISAQTTEINQMNQWQSLWYR